MRCHGNDYQAWTDSALLQLVNEDQPVEERGL